MDSSNIYPVWDKHPIYNSSDLCIKHFSLSRLFLIDDPFIFYRYCLNPDSISLWNWLISPLLLIELPLFDPFSLLLNEVLSWLLKAGEVKWANPLYDPAIDPLFNERSSLSFATNLVLIVKVYIYSYLIFYRSCSISRFFLISNSSSSTFLVDW